MKGVARRAGRRLGPVLLVAAMACGRTGSSGGANPHPVHLLRPKAAPLSPIAELGRAIFHDRGLSSSGRLACASCHSPARAYGPPDARSAQLGGPEMRDQGARAVPSLRYLDRMPAFTIGPDNPAAEGVSVVAVAARPAGAVRTRKSAGRAGGVPPIVPRGGLFWDGRANTLESQAMSPLFNPVEMANADTSAVADHLRRAEYGGRFAQLFGAATVAPDRRLVDEAMFAVARYQLEDSSFHPYTSKYDAYLEGKATLTPEEARGLRLFEDPAKGNCAACHLSRPSADGRPPAFTDDQYEALGVPRNPALAANRDPRHYDLGLCGPYRTDLAARRRYCGMFRTPSLRNVALRRVFFHNGVYHSLERVLDFYDFRDADPGRIYPRERDGRVLQYDDLPPAYRGNVDTVDAPFGRRPGDAPPLNARDTRDIIAFLKTLTDGYRP